MNHRALKIASQDSFSKISWSKQSFLQQIGPQEAG